MYLKYVLEALAIGATNTYTYGGRGGVDGRGNDASWQRAGRQTDVRGENRKSGAARRQVTAATPVAMGYRGRDQLIRAISQGYRDEMRFLHAACARAEGRKPQMPRDPDACWPGRLAWKMQLKEGRNTIAAAAAKARRKNNTLRKGRRPSHVDVIWALH